jgi:hypothetical protein
MAGLRTSLTPFQWFAATLPTALIPTPLTWQKNANIPLRAAVLAEPPARSVGTRHTGRKNRASRRRTAHSISAAGWLRCSLTSPMYSLKGEGSFDGFGRCWGYFRLCSFHTPICTPISLSQGQRSLANGAVCPRPAAMNSEKQERAMSGE